MYMTMADLGEHTCWTRFTVLLRTTEMRLPSNCITKTVRGNFRGKKQPSTAFLNLKRRITLELHCYYSFPAWTEN